MTTTMKPPPSDTGACGTPLGQNRHTHRREQSCQPCRDADNVLRRRQRSEAQARPLPTGPLPSTFGQYAARPVLHRAQLVGGQCVECFGWRDDFRHLGLA